MNLKEAILSRRSIRVYNNNVIKREEIIEILNTAIYAPNHQFRQTWRFILIDGEAKEKLLNNLEIIFSGVTPEEAKVDYRKKVISSSTAILVVVNQKNNDDLIWTLEEYGASVALMQNFMLLADELKIGTCFKSKLIQGKLVEYLGVKDNEMVAGAITMGFYDDKPTVKERITAEDKLTIL
ncbi:MAG: nitroreductase [Haloplasmataceae bacterium]|jgi:nitroreductase|nr:nitroreductase [Haloplasmataceae bacterium]